MDTKDLYEFIDSKIQTFYGPISQYDENAKIYKKGTRYRSWEYCYKFFRENLPEYDELSEEEKKEFIDLASLHLGFYLASWGMYRGSAFLLKNDYKIHESAVRKIIEYYQAYPLLLEFDPTQSTGDETSLLLDVLFGTDEDIANLKKDKKYGNVKANKSWKGLIGELEDIYEDGEYEDNESNEDNASDTLVTKVLMGTLACIPAYDRFLKLGIAFYKNNNAEKFNKITQTLSKESYKNLLSFVSENKENFENASVNLSIDETLPYPTMKLVDMFLWQTGFEEDMYNASLKSDTTAKKIEEFIKYFKKIGDYKTLDKRQQAILYSIENPEETQEK